MPEVPPPFPATAPVARPLALPIPAPEPESRRGSRRRRLWELAHKCHCPLVGVCFGVAELRAAMTRVMAFPRDSGDFVLHTSAVGACESRSPLAEVLQRTLEKRFAADLRRFAAAKDSGALRRLWRETLAAGCGIPGALWAAWSHPACDQPLEQEIYADIHMLQHQVGSGTRADLETLQALRRANGELRRALDALQRESEDRRRELSGEIARRDDRLQALRSELAGKEALAARLTGQLESLREALPAIKDRQGLLRRAVDAEGRAAALTARLADLERICERLAQHRHPEEAPPPPAPEPALPPIPLAGRCVLCVGGRSGSVDAYRELVESRGGRFLHHDGGLEESLHRIDGALAAADLVICQAGCISHNAYWRVKEQCKRTGKRCIYVKTAGVSAFARSVATVAAAPQAPA